MSAASIVAVAANANIRLLGFDEIEVNQEVQSRHHYSKEHERNLYLVIQQTQQRISAPVVVFDDGHVKILADGFHRYGAGKAIARAYPKNADLNHIWAEIRQGTLQDAMVYSASCNQVMTLPRTDDDIKKAISMLLKFPEWAQAPTSRIATHVGVIPQKAKKLRDEIRAENGEGEQLVVIDKRGNIIPAKRSIAIVPVAADEEAEFVGHDDQGNVTKRFNVQLKETPKTQPISTDLVMKLCRSNGVEAKRIGRNLGIDSCFGGVEGRTAVSGKKFIVSATSLSHPEALGYAVGNAEVLTRLSGGKSCTTIVVCQPNSSVKKVIGAINDKFGICFMSPDEFVEYATEEGE